MKKTLQIKLFILLALFLASFSACGGGDGSTTSSQTSSNTQTTATTNQGGGASTSSSGSGGLRNENWLIGTWTATIPGSETNYFKGNKIELKFASVELNKKEEIQGHTSLSYAYTGNLVWDNGQETLGFGKADAYTGDSVIIWNYLEQIGGMYMENISLRVYDGTMSFELDWQAVSKAGSTYKTLDFYGDIQNLDTSNKDYFKPSGMITFTHTSTSAPVVTTVTPTEIKTTTTTTAYTPPATVISSKIWDDIPLYPNAKETENSNIISGDDGAQSGWRTFVTNDSVSTVGDFFVAQMETKGWTQDSWGGTENIASGSFSMNDNARSCGITLAKDGDQTTITIMSSIN